MSRAARRFLLSFGLVAAFACGGDGCDLGLGSCAESGCSSCSGCAGCEGCAVEPIPDGFPPEARVPNAAQARLTSSGVEYVEENLADLAGVLLPDGLTVPIPPTDFSVAGTDYTMCPDADCLVAIDIRRFVLDAVEPNRLEATIEVAFDGRGPDGMHRHVPLRVDSPLIPAYTCEVELDSIEGDRDTVTAYAEIDFAEETRPPRMGLTFVDVSTAELVEGRGVESADVRVSGCILGPLFNAVRPILIGIIEGEIADIARGAARMCVQNGELGCPPPSVAVPDAADPTSICRYEGRDDADCVTGLLGFEGRTDLGFLLAGFSPGVHARLDMLFAAGGEGQAVGDGMTLNFFGGVESLGRDACLPFADRTPPEIPTIPEFAALRGNQIPGRADEAHVGIGISEQFLNYAGWGAWDAGFLCIGTGTTLAQELSTGLFGILARSLRNLSFPEANAPLGIILRPQRPPVFEVGAGDTTEPLLTVSLPEAQVDFYVFSSERYIRFMTFEADLTIPVDIDVDDGALVPRIGDPVVENERVFNSELLEEDPDALAGALADILAGFAGMIAGAITPIELPALMGIQLEVPPGGLVGVDEGADEVLGIFANLAPAPPAPLTATVETRATVSGLRVDEVSHRLETWGRGRLPSFHLAIDAVGPPGEPLEYSYRVDRKQWSRWSRERFHDVVDRTLLFQARHTVEARARVVGQRRSADPTPAAVELLVDLTPPEVRLRPTDGAATRVSAEDLLTAGPELRFRARLDEGRWTDWAPLGEAAIVDTADAGWLDVEVVDEAGNVGSAHAAIIRGRPAPSGGGCACELAPGAGRGRAGWLAGLSLAVVAVGIRRGKNSGG